MAVETDQLAQQKKRLWKTEIKALLGPCMITFSIPLFIPGFTITLVAFTDETGFSKYGVLHVLGILILTLACLLLVVGCVTRCACASQIHPLEEISHHKVTTHEKKKEDRKMRERLPSLTLGQAGGSSPPRLFYHPQRLIDSTILESESETETETSDSYTVQDSLQSIQQQQQHYDLNGLPYNNFMSEDQTTKEERANMEKQLFIDAVLGDNTDIERSLKSDLNQKKTGAVTLSVENEVNNQKNKLMCPSFTDMRRGDANNASSDQPERDELESCSQEGTINHPVNGWVMTENPDRLRGNVVLSESPSQSESSFVPGNNVDEDDDVTLTEASRNCSTVPEIADLDRTDSVEVDRFNNVWRGDSQNSVEISSVLSQDEYSEESLSVISKDQLEIADPSGSRGRTSSDSALESGGDHSRALSHRVFDRTEIASSLVEEAPFETFEDRHVTRRDDHETSNRPDNVHRVDSKDDDSENQTIQSVLEIRKEASL